MTNSDKENLYCELIDKIFKQFLTRISDYMLLDFKNISAAGGITPEKYTFSKLNVCRKSSL
jgi:hypothetical protein